MAVRVPAVRWCGEALDTHLDLLGTQSSGTSGQKSPPGVDTSVSLAARVWVYWRRCGNYPVDRG
jgi:hypothetical protein